RRKGTDGMLPCVATVNDEPPARKGQIPKWAESSSAAPAIRQNRYQVLSGITLGLARHVFRSSLRDNAPARLAAFRAEINDPIRRFDDIEVVLDDEQRVARGAEFEQHFQQLGHVREMQSRRRLIENVEGPARLLAAQFRCEFHPL